MDILHSFRCIIKKNTLNFRDYKHLTGDIVSVFHDVYVEGQLMNASVDTEASEHMADSFEMAQSLNLPLVNISYKNM